MKFDKSLLKSAGTVMKFLNRQMKQQIIDISQITSTSSTLDEE